MKDRDHFADMEKLLDNSHKAAEAAKQERPGVPEDQLLASLSGGKAKTYEEVNAGFEVMFFICRRIESCAAPSHPDCVKLTCGNCKAPVWMTPPTKVAYDRINKKFILCNECAPVAMAQSDAKHRAEGTPITREHFTSMSNEILKGGKPKASVGEDWAEEAMAAHRRKLAEQPKEETGN